MSLLIDLTKGVRGKDISKASPELREARLNICKSCPHLVKSTMSCGKVMRGGTVEHNGEKKELCGCIVTDKTRYADDACPLGKW